MQFTLKPTHFFLEQLKEISPKSKNLLKQKLSALKTNPFKNKRIVGYKLFLFRIRFSDSKKEKRVIYLIDGKEVKVVCIIDRKKDYKDLKRYLKKLGYL